jgi:hypothetical protein
MKNMPAINNNHNGDVLSKSFSSSSIQKMNPDGTII